MTTSTTSGAWSAPLELGSDGSVLRLLTSAASHGTVLVLPGGGYVMRADYEADPVAEWLAGLGIASGVVDYTVPVDDPDALVSSVQAAVAHVRDVRPDEPVGLLGFSAGGHLAGLVGTAGGGVERPDALVLCYPGVSLVRLPLDPPALQLLPSGHEHRAAELSLERRIDDATSPTFLWHTSDDELLDVDNLYHLASTLAAHHVPTAVHVFPHGRHGLGMAAEDPSVGQWTTLCAQWLGDRGFGSPS